MIPILLVSELKGKLARISYSSESPLILVMRTYYSSLSIRFIPRESANLTRATSSGDEAWYSLYDGLSASG